MTIDAESLVDNASLFGIEATESLLVRVGRDWRYITVLTATSLEQLTKAALANRNPLLLAETSEKSVLSLSGASGYGDPRTIGARKAIERYMALNPRFRKVSGHMRDLIDLRNGVVHLSAEQPEDFDRVFDSYLKAVEILIDDLDGDEEVFWGSELFPVVEARRDDRAKNIEQQVDAKLALALATLDTKYRDLTNEEREGAIRAAEHTATRLVGDVSVQFDCPACGSLGVVDAWLDVEWELEDFEFRGYVHTTSLLFKCLVCDLRLDDEEAEWGLQAFEISDFVDANDFFVPPELDDVSGLSMDDVHPYPPPH